MDTELNIENLSTHVLQHALQQTSSLIVDRSTEYCVICLGDIVEPCEARPCQHNNFDYLCLITWLQQRATCPLCNSEVHEVRYEMSEDKKQGKIYKVPKASVGSDESSRQVEEALNRSALLSAVQRRRFVYRHNLYSYHVGSNKRQPVGSSYRELSPHHFVTDPELISRARMWLRRELRVFEFLNTSEDLPHDHGSARRPRVSNAEYLLEYVIMILRSIDIQDSAGQAENIIRQFLGRRNTPLFLHELKAWLSSPYKSLGAWDRNVQYNSGPISPSQPQTIGRELGERSNVVLKYNEPAEARKPSSTQAWRLYVFKGNDILEVIELWKRSVWLLGREERVVDVVTPHPSCSGQHAALQFRYIAKEDEKKEERKLMDDKDKGCVKLYLIDLDSTHSTRLNRERVEGSCYIELKSKDVVNFGGSNREYVLILPPS